MKEKRNYRKPGLSSFGNEGIREDAAMAFLQAGSPTELTCAATQDVPVCEKDFCVSGDYCPAGDSSCPSVDVPR